MVQAAQQQGFGVIGIPPGASRPRSFVVVGIIAGSQRHVSGMPLLDSTNTIAVRIDGFTQRVGEEIGDLVGKVYNSMGNPVTLQSVEFSDAGDSGPWRPATILVTDPLFSFPAIGTPAGEAFAVPARLYYQTTGPIWLRMKVSY